MKKWEYTRITVNTNMDGYIEKLNRWGGDGWEVVDVHESFPPRFHIILLKREIGMIE